MHDFEIESIFFISIIQNCHSQPDAWFWNWIHFYHLHHWELPFPIWCMVLKLIPFESFALLRWGSPFGSRELDTKRKWKSNRKIVRNGHGRTFGLHHALLYHKASWQIWSPMMKSFFWCSIWLLKGVPPTLLHFVRVRVAYQPHVKCNFDGIDCCIPLVLSLMYMVIQTLVLLVSTTTFTSKVCKEQSHIQVDLQLPTRGMKNWLKTLQYHNVVKIISSLFRHFVYLMW